MAFSLKTWVNRISEYPNRRKLTHEDGSTELVTVARAEGQISAEGNAFSAEEMNDLENRIKGGFDEVNQSLINKSTLIDLIYPVGSIFITITPKDPGTYLGGSWTLLTDCFLLGAGNKYAVNKTGGEATHTLTASELPTHVHRILSGTGSASNGNYDGYISMGYIANNYDGNRGMITDDIFAVGHSNFCGNKAHNNMPPYYTVYMYRRDK